MAVDVRFIEATLFFVELPRLPTDPGHVKRRARVLYGEGRLKFGDFKPSARTENAAGVRILRLIEEVATFEAILSSAEWDHRTGIRFGLGLVHRPPILGLPSASIESAALDTLFAPSVRAGSVVSQFLQINKRELAESIVAAIGERAAEAALDRINFLTAQNLRHAKQVALFGDVFIVDDLAVRDAVVSWKAITDDERRSRGIRISIESDQAPVDGLVINLRIYGADHAPLLDDLYTWKPGEPSTIDVQCNQAPGGAWLKVWSAGRLVGEQAFALLQSIGGFVNLQSGSIWLEDKLTRKTARAVAGKRANKDALARVGNVAQRSPIEMKLGHTHESPWFRTRMQATADVFEFIRPAREPDTYFPAGEEGRAMAVDYLRTAIAATSESLIVDPFFDEEGARDLLPRIENSQVNVSILTSLGGDDGSALQRLTGALRDLNHRGLLPTTLVVRQLPGKKSFHDRNVVLIKSDATPPTLLSLTNSLSGAAKDFSLSIHTPGPFATAARLAEIWRDWANSADYVIWPERAAPLNRQPMRDRFPRWPQFLEWLIPRDHMSDREWQQAAAADKWLEVQTDSTVEWKLRDLDPSHQARISEVLNKHYSASKSLDEQMAALYIWGEAIANGLPITAEQVASLMCPQSPGAAEIVVPGLVDELRRTFVAGIDRASMSVQSMFAAELHPETVGNAFLAFNSHFHPFGSWSHDWGREFIYAVLCVLSPDKAVTLMHELNDPTLLVQITSTFGFERVDNMAGVALALSRSQVPFSRALGIQFLVVNRMIAIGSSGPVAPTDPMIAVQHLRNMDVPARELATCCVVWLGSSRMAGGDGPEALATAFIASCEGLETADLIPLLGFLLRRHRYALPVAMRVAENTAVELSLCRALLDVLAVEFAPTESNDVSLFISDADEPMAATIGRAALVLATSDQTATSILRETFRLDDQLRLCRPVTPLRRRQFSAAALNAAVWCQLSQICAASEPERAAVLAEAQSFLAEFGADLQNAERQVLERAAERAEAVSHTSSV